ncbi:hypothetical protein ACTXT7_015746 [Hymenolepis weldensis]
MDHRPLHPTFGSKKVYFSLSCKSTIFLGHDFHMVFRQTDCLSLLIYNQKCSHEEAVVASLTMEDDAVLKLPMTASDIKNMGAKEIHGQPGVSPSRRKSTARIFAYWSGQEQSKDIRNANYQRPITDNATHPILFGPLSRLLLRSYYHSRLLSTGSSSVEWSGRAVR